MFCVGTENLLFGNSTFSLHVRALEEVNTLKGPHPCLHRTFPQTCFYDVILHANFGSSMRPFSCSLQNAKKNISVLIYLTLTWIEKKPKQMCCAQLGAYSCALHLPKASPRSHHRPNPFLIWRFTADVFQLIRCNSSSIWKFIALLFSIFYSAFSLFYVLIFTTNAGKDQDQNQFVVASNSSVG